MGALADAVVRMDIARLAAWGRVLAGLLGSGHRLLVAGNGGSAAEAQHLTAELVGRFQADRMPLSALALHADSSSVTAIGNDLGYDEVFARQVQAHGRAGDVLLALSASGNSANLVRAVETARRLGITTWALTGPAPNTLAALSDEVLAVAAPSAATVQECHLAAIHVLCAAVDGALAAGAAPGRVIPARGDAGAGARAAEKTTYPGNQAVSGAERRLVIVGDTVLDRDVSGCVERLSPEAPVPVVSSPQTAARPGGAGLAALMAAQEAGWAVTLATALGADEAGDEVRSLLVDAGVEVADMGVEGKTAVKCRIRAQGRTLLRVDDDPGQVNHGGLPARARAALGTASAVLVCDYGRGITAQPEVRAAVAEAARRIPVVWDPHPAGSPPVEGVALVVPAASEAREAAAGVVEGAGLAQDVHRAHHLLRMWPVRLVAITRGREGAVLVQDDQAPPLVVPAVPVVALDECGAGDQFAVTATVMLGAGKVPSEAVAGAVKAASAYVAGGGPAGLTAGRRGAADGADAWDLLEQVRARGGSIVAAGGCFDLLHSGHLSLLEQARRLGDCLVVCLNSDASVARLKGEGRPLVPARERAAMLQALTSVDAVVVFGEDTPGQVLARVRPDIYVKGGDYAIGQIPESALVESWGGQVVLLPYLAGRSTTALIDEAARRGAAR